MVINIAYLVLGLAVGIFIGIFMFGLGITRLIGGTLKSAENDDGDPYLFLDLDRHPDDIMNGNYAIFRVDHSRIKSHD